MFPFHGAQNRFDGGNIGAVPIEEFVAERKTVLIDDQRQNQLLAIGTVIPRIARRIMGFSSAVPSTYVLVKS